MEKKNKERQCLNSLQHVFDKKTKIIIFVNESAKKPAVALANVFTNIGKIWNSRISFFVLGNILYLQQIFFNLNAFFALGVAKHWCTSNAVKKLVRKNLRPSHLVICGALLEKDNRRRKKPLAALDCPSPLYMVRLFLLEVIIHWLCAVQNAHFWYSWEHANDAGGLQIEELQLW